MITSPISQPPWTKKTPPPPFSPSPATAVVWLANQRALQRSARGRLGAAFFAATLGGLIMKYFSYHWDFFWGILVICYNIGILIIDNYPISIISIFLDNLDIIGQLDYDPRISKDIQSLLLSCLCFFNFVTINWWTFKDQTAWRFPKGFWQAQLMGFFPKGKHTKNYWKWLFIVDLPTNSMVMFRSYVNVYQRVRINSEESTNEWLTWVCLKHW